MPHEIFLRQPQADPAIVFNARGDVATIGAKPVRPETLVGPIRRRYRVSQALWYTIGIIETLLMFRFVLRFIGANTKAGFTQFIYTTSAPFAGAFENVIDPVRVDGSVFEGSLLLAMAVYALLAWGIVRLLIMSRPISDGEAEERLEVQQ